MEYKDIKEIVKDMGESKIDELKIEFPDGTKISMKKNDQKVVYKAEPEVHEVVIPQTSTVSTIVNANSENKVEENYKEIKAPMVGTFYSKSSPTAKPFVSVGDKVKKGDVVCIIEAMKLMNEITAEEDGVISEICVTNGRVVEFGTELFRIKR